MVNFVTSITLLLTAVSTVVALPNTLEKRAVTCRDDRPNSELANVRQKEFLSFLWCEQN